jgi:hypothetical protein
MLDNRVRTGFWLLVPVTFALSAHRFVDPSQAVPPSASAQTDAALTIPIELLANRPLIRIRINQKGPFAMLVDPTAPTTVVDQSLVTELATRPQSDRTVQVEMEFASGHFSNVTATVGDVSNIVPDLTVARPRGIIGRVGMAGSTHLDRVRSLASVDRHRQSAPDKLAGHLRSRTRSFSAGTRFLCGWPPPCPAPSLRYLQADCCFRLQ